MKHPEGLFGWIDLATSDVAAAKEFYAGLFGWTFEDLATPMGVFYTQATLDGALVAGLAPMQQGMAEAGMPSTWNSYVITADADAAIARATVAGGQALMPAMDVMEQGRMAMLIDPSGAVVGVWQPAAHEGADVFNIPGTLTWNELQSRDVDAALPFYAETFGWEWSEGPQEGYFIANVAGKAGDDKTNAGAMAMPPGVPEEAPSFWLVYFAVDDCDEAMARGQELGASMLFPAMQMGPGRFGGLVDPTGAVFAVGSFGG